ncbi:hypothetical protein BSL78_05606 [Apostichopus japonicus]|uniref:G protein-coupled receptor GPR1/2/3 C-terminal domain-containing protein n=1 Tax=Stichopus japonicus TaxID=307972 RepID=A0A2G8LB05_STIJA|nr:hypothetical protein BSL78_05606 [Apostichopus japonicus]
MGIQMNSSAEATCLSFYSPEECTIILIARIICAAASFLGSLDNLNVAAVLDRQPISKRHVISPAEFKSEDRRRLSRTLLGSVNRCDNDTSCICFYVEYLVIILVIFALYAKVVYTVLTLKPIWRERPTENHRYEVYKRLVRPMMLYPLAILLVSIFPIVYRALTFRKPFREPPFILAVFHIVSVPLWGTLFAIVYVLDPETRKDLHWLNIKNTIQDRIHGTRIREVQIKDYPEATSPEATGQSAAPDRKSTISDVSIEPSTVYPHSIKK